MHSSINKWDVGMKLFASNKQAEILGYCGDVTFPNQVLSQICNQIDIGMLFGTGDTFDSKLAKIESTISNAYESYPQEHKKSFQILYACRIGEGMISHFHIAQICGDSKGGLLTNILKLPESSALIDGVSSGAESLKKWYGRWQKSDVSGTSRSVFSAFCDSLQSGEDKLSGGAPQLIGIYRRGSARVFGIVLNGKRYVGGCEVPHAGQFGAVEWRNFLFERCDSNSMKLLSGAQPQPRPTNVPQR
jgi:hypothetical protein